MGKQITRKRAMQLNQDELETLKKLVCAAKNIVHRSLDNSYEGNEIKDIENTLNAFGKALTWDNEKVLEPKVKY